MTCSVAANCARPWEYRLCFLLLLPIFAGKFCSSVNATEKLAKNQILSGEQTIVSQGGIFELGFFTKSKNNIYLGIWYKDFPEKTIVWVANREAPISNASRISSLQLSEEGDLVLLDDSGIVWSTNLTLSLPQPDLVEAVLLDSGNLVLRGSSESSSSILWQSFDHPTDTWLPGAKFGFKTIGPSQRLEIERLISWKNSDDPSPGMFSAVVDTDNPGGQLLLEWNESTKYWTTGTWTGEFFGLVPEMSYTAKFSLVSTPLNETYFTYSLVNDIIFSRLVMDSSGLFNQLTAVRSLKTWDHTFSQPRDPCDVYGYCGEFGVCSGKSTTSPCKCLQGFDQVFSANERMNGGPRGCRRKAPLLCEDSTSSTGKSDGFLQISNVGLSINSITQPAQDAAGCKSACLGDCSCSAYSYDGNGCRMWRDALLDLKDNSNLTDNQQILHVKVANSELQNASGQGHKKKKLMIIIAVVVSVAVPVLGGLTCLGIRKLKKRGYWNKDLGRDLLAFEFSYSNNIEDNQIRNVDSARIAAENEFDLPMFSYSSVCAATDNFSVGKKLGEGGFGPVYKGVLLKGQEIAVKRLSRKSGQGLEEFRNEILLIAKLQHRNLVRLLGCCIDKDEKILIYEYMPNKSLDLSLFEPNKQVILDWRTRECIIEGIAQGILYLHQYSRLRIIHRDLKASNILLDSEMNPKISDFGMARIFCGNTSEANTNRIVGTYGYMAPEYALGGLSSIKSDVFSFGVLVLEIVSGRKNAGFYNSDSLNLLGHAWELWISNRAMDLVDPSLDCPPALAVLRCINIGLLCVQENPNDRPTMSNVVCMLSNQHLALPSPKQPAFTVTRLAIKTSSTSSCNAPSFSVNGLTVSSVEPR